MSLGQQSQTWFPTHVQVTVLQAKALRSKGKAGSNDAYAIIQLGKEKYSTTVAEKAVAPVWKEEATFEVPLLHNDNQERCTVRVIVMHRALVGMDKFLGQVELNLWELHQTKNRRKVQWYPLKSKPGKKEKERGQIEVEIQFKRNNMTASMFDLSMKEKSRSPFGKIKDKLKGKHRDGFPDTASAIVPSSSQYPDDSDEEMPEAEKKKFKLKTMFNKPGLKKNSISQSMSVLPTFQPSSQKTVLKPSDFSSDFNQQASGSPVSERKFPHLPVIMTHKRTASADTKQLNQITSNNKKEGLSLFSGMRSKNDPITRSNLCINGNHVYMEQTEPRSESPKDGSHSNSPQISRKTPLYASAENLSSKPSKETVTTSNNIPENVLSSSSSSDSVKSLTLPAQQNSRAEEPRSKSPPLVADVPKEPKENKKQENKMSTLLSMMTGRKDAPKTEVENVPEMPVKNDRQKVNSNVNMEVPHDQSKKASLNPFQDDLIEEQSEQPPQPLERTSKTSAVKPRLDVSSEAETKAKLSSSSPSNPSFLEASFYGGLNAPFTASKLDKEKFSQNKSALSESPDISNSISGPSLNKGLLSPSESSAIPETEGNSEGSSEPSDSYEKPSLPLFWRSGVSQNKPSEPKEVQVVAPFSEKNKVKKTYVKSLLDQIKGKSTSTSPTDAVDVDLVKGILPSLQDTPLDQDEDSFMDHKPAPVVNKLVDEESDFFTIHSDGRKAELETFDGKLLDSVSQYMKEPPKPSPRTQTLPKKEEIVEELKPIPPKPAPRSASKANKIPAESVSEGVQSSQLMDKFQNDEHVNTEQASRVGSSMITSTVQSAQTVANMKMAMPFNEDLSYRLDELPVIPENPEGTSDDEQLDSKNVAIVDNASRSKTSVLPLVEATPYITKPTNTSSSKSERKDIDVEKKDKQNEVTKVLTEKSFHDVPDGAMERSSSKDDIDRKGNESSDSTHPSDCFPHTNSLLSSSPVTSVSLPTTNSNTHQAQSPANTDGSQKEDNSGKKKLLRAWVSPSETHPIPTVQSSGAVSSRQRTNPVKPMNASQNKPSSTFSQPIKGYENALNTVKKYDTSDPASAYAQLTHDELIQLVLKQKETLTKKEAQVRELEDYIDNLLVRVMEETPNILRNGVPLNKKAGKV
ncbi:rab11 family-interacting protein 1 [Pelobates fuscus]|uniref:rab11 family-interacting protein 1 n=1 Tax=Pelobates fuscus TaxID=191477 RepID=UPI002FE4F2E6